MKRKNGVDTTTAGNSFTALLMNHGKRLKKSLQPVMLDRIKVKIPKDEEILYIHYRAGNFYRNMGLIMAIIMPVFGMTLLYQGLYMLIPLFDESYQPPNILWYILMCIGIGFVPLLLYKWIDTFHVFNVAVFTDKKVHLLMYLGRQGSLSPLTPAIGSVNLNEIMAYFHGKWRVPTMKPFEGIQVLPTKQQPIGFVRQQPNRFFTVSSLYSFSIMRTVFESILFKQHPVGRQAELYYEKIKENPPNLDGNEEFSPVQWRLDKIRKKKAKVIAGGAVVASIAIAIMILLLSFFPLDFSASSSLEGFMIPLFTIIFAPFAVVFAILIALVEFAYLARYKLPVDATVMVGDEGIVYKMDGRNHFVPYTRDMRFRVARSSKNETYPLWGDCDTLVINTKEGQRVKIGPFDRFPDFYYTFLYKYSRWLDLNGGIFSPEEIKAAMVAHDPFKHEIVKKLGHEDPSIGKPGVQSRSPERVSFETIPDELLEPNLKYSLPTYKQYLDKDEYIIHHYRPKHLVAQFFSPGLIVYLTVIGVFLWLTLGPLGIGAYYMVPFIGSILVFMFGCLFLFKKIPHAIFLRKIELVFTPKKMIIAWGKNIAIVPRENFMTFTMGKVSPVFNVYTRASILFKIPLNQSPYIIKNTFYLYWLDPDDDIIPLLEQFTSQGA